MEPCTIGLVGVARSTRCVGLGVTEGVKTSLRAVWEPGSSPLAGIGVDGRLNPGKTVAVEVYVAIEVLVLVGLLVEVKVLVADGNGV